jgi:hypothetical protein
MRASMTSPFPPEFQPTHLEVICRSNLNPVSLLIRYRLLRSLTIRVFLILSAEIPYFFRGYYDQLNLVKIFMNFSAGFEARS